MGGQVCSLKRDLFARNSFDTVLDSYKHIDNKSEKPKYENYENP